MDRKQHEAKVVVLGILASLVRTIPSMTYMTWGFDRALPYTYPKYSVQGGELKEMWPIIRDEEGLRNALSNPELWSQFISQLSQQDIYYSPILFGYSWADTSSSMRLLRRAWAKRCEKEVEQDIMGPQGFVQESDAIKTLNAIILAFSESARLDGRIPVLLLVHDYGYSDFLYRAVQGNVCKYNIPTVSTNVLCSASDPGNFNPADGGHFTTEANILIARALLLEIEMQLNIHKKNPL